MIYNPSPTAKAFHASTKLVRMMIGPIGSGKTVAMIMEILIKAHAQPPNAQNIRRSRWAVVRNTYMQLVDTTMKTWFEWFKFGTFLRKHMSWTLSMRLEDGTKVELEVIFRALDKQGDLRKLLSMEMTGMFINEVREMRKDLFDMMPGRTGRFPEKKYMGWRGVIMDTNPPDSDHWIYTLFEEENDNNDNYCEKFHQPSGLSDKAENKANLVDNYYESMLFGKNKEWVNVYVHGRYGFVSSGKPVYPEYKDDIHHIQKQPIIDPKDYIYVGIDFGLTPAASIGRKAKSGQFQILDELVTFDMGIQDFGKMLRERLTRDYPSNQIMLYGDPSGRARSQNDKITPFQVLSHAGLNVYPTYTNSPLIRREVVAEHLTRLDFNGDPAFAICPKATFTRKAFAGGYKYKRVQSVGDDRYTDIPDKNKYSHISDACQYMFIGAVGGDRVVGGFKKKKANKTLMNRMVV